MVEFDTSKIGYSLKLDGKYYNTLDIEGFSHMMKDPSYCYKFYWLEAIVQLIAEGIKETTFDAVIDEMICNAWYSVREFHIHLSGMPIDGQVKDGLERAVSKLSELSNLPANASKVEIKNAIKKYALELKTSKEQLTNMVPYRALAGFFDRAEEPADWGSVRRMTEYIERINEHVVILPYTLGTCWKASRTAAGRKSKLSAKKFRTHRCLSSRWRFVPVVEHGEFGADMKVDLSNDGPFTILLDSNEL